MFHLDVDNLRDFLLLIPYRNHFHLYYECNCVDDYIESSYSCINYHKELACACYILYINNNYIQSCKLFFLNI